MRIPPIGVAALLLLAPPAGADGVIFVTNTNDSGAGSLRQAIVAANAAAGGEIQFAIASEGVQAISLATPLPPIGTGISIDGSTQSGASCASWPPLLTVAIDASNLLPGEDALSVVGSLVSIRGLAVHGAPGDGISVAASGFTLTCSFLGTDAAGTQDLGNDANGLLLDGATGAQIGGVAPGDGNLFSGNRLSGIAIRGGASQNSIDGNHIGVGAAGGALANDGAGILIEDGSDNAIGAPGTGNEIRSNAGGGVLVSGATSLGNSIRGNQLAGNASIGIDLLGADFADPNDALDADAGPNRLQNTPALGAVSLTVAPATLHATFSVDSAPANASYPLAIDFYHADADDEEGEIYLGSTTYAEADFATGNVTRDLAPLGAVAVGDRVVATATDAAGNTSEFSAGPAIVAVPEPGAAAAALTGALAVVFRRRRARRRPERFAQSSDWRAPTSTEAT